jgi:ATP-dependent DNA helicase PIF1
MLLSLKNKHERDCRIKFESKGHKYWIDDDDKDLISVTTFIHTFFPPFDSGEIISNIMEKDEYHNDPKYKYYKMNAADIQKKWKDCTSKGTNLHESIEKYLNNENVDNSSLEFQQFLNFMNDHKDKLSIFRTEWMIFSKILKLTGSVDALFQNKEGEFIIYDWKRIQALYQKSYDGKTGYPPFENIPHCNFGQYSLQLNLYRVLLEYFYGIKIKEMFLIILFPENSNYTKVKVDRMDREGDLLLDCRISELINMGYDKDSFSSLNLVHKINREEWTEEEDGELEDVVKSGFPLDKFAKSRSRSLKDVSKRVLQKAFSSNPKKELNIESSTLKSFLEKKGSVFEKSINECRYIDNNKNKTCEMSVKQKKCYEYMSSGYNLLMTGEGGTGKSTLIKMFVSEYSGKKKIAITATTGAAAILLNGTTLHSYLGIGLGNLSEEVLYLQIHKKHHILKRWKELDVLIIDEISMLEPRLLDKLEKLAKAFRKNNNPFGGIQLILTGDFFQLPNIGQPNLFCFDAECWEKCIDVVINLDHNFRQSDNQFQRCLSEIRYGKITDDTVTILKSRENKNLSNVYGILPTKIYSLNYNVDAENEKQMDLLFDKNNNLVFYEFEMKYEVLKKGLRNVDDKINKLCNVSYNLQLCVGAQVMLIYNLDMESKLVNGSRGVVVSFVDDIPRVKFLNGEIRTINRKIWEIQENNEVIITVSQIPLKLAYACSVHRSQGMTIDYAEIDLAGIFEYGQAYVALSRVRSLKGLSIKNFDVKCIKAHPRVIEFYNKNV